MSFINPDTVLVYLLFVVFLFVWAKALSEA